MPFLGEANPFWLGLGTIAFDLLLAVMITGLLRNRIGRRTFRLVHWATYALWPISLVHALGTGTDAGSLAFLVFAGLCSAAVVGAVIWRLMPRFGRHADDLSPPALSPVHTAAPAAAPLNAGSRS